MPELPETETIARDLDAALRGATIAGFEAPRPDVLREHDAAAFARVVTGRRVARVWRRAKLVVLDLAGDATASVCAAAPDADATHAAPGVAAPAPAPATPSDAGGPWRIVVQPRFTGGLLVQDAARGDEAPGYVTATWTLADGRLLHYRDVRRLGTVALMDGARFAEYTGTLGPEPLDETCTPAAFSALLRASRQFVKVALMDQRRLAGVGNIYANEALWHAGIDPSRPADSLSASEALALHAALRRVLAAAVAARGTSFRDYRDAHGGRGGFVAQLAAYGRGGAPCRRCGRRLVDTHAIDGRTTVFCPSCQR